MIKLWSEKIPYIKKLKEFYSHLEHKGINLWPIMANEVYTYYKNQEQRTEKEIKLFILKSLFFKDNFPINGKKGGILVSFFMPRKDHRELVYKTIESIPKEDITLLDCYDYKQKNPFWRSSIRLPNIFLLWKLFRLFKKNNLKKILGKRYYFFIARTYLRYKEINQFGKIFEKYAPKAHLAFCSQASEGDAILTLIAKKNNIPTFTLQHGLIVDYPQFQSVEILKENIISDYNLIWGDTTNEILKKYVPSSKLIIVGNPKYSELIINKDEKFNPKKGVIFFPVLSRDVSTNQIMAKVINNFAKKHPEITFELSVHPFDSLENYKEIMNSKNINFVASDIPINQRIAESDFMILHNTTIAMEALRYGKPIFRFKDKNLVSLWENEDTFKNEKDLEKIFKSLDKKEIFHKWKTFYQEEFKKNFYLSGKSTSEYYKEKIYEKIKTRTQ